MDDNFRQRIDVKIIQFWHSFSSLYAARAKFYYWENALDLKNLRSNGFH